MEERALDLLREHATGARSGADEVRDEFGSGRHGLDSSV